MTACLGELPMSRERISNCTSSLMYQLIAIIPNSHTSPSVIPEPTLPTPHTLKLSQLRSRALATSLCAKKELRCRPEKETSCLVLAVVLARMRKSLPAIESSSEFLGFVTTSPALFAYLLWMGCGKAGFIHLCIERKS